MEPQLRIEVRDPGFCFRIQDHQRMLVFALGGYLKEVCKQSGAVRPNGRTVARLFLDGAGEDNVVLPKGKPVMGIRIPADHIGEGVIAVHLRIKLIVSGE
jgi:hypothetical protein